MIRTRLGTVVPILILLLFILSCNLPLYTESSTPTQKIDLPPMIGKSLQEMTAMFGPPKAKGICHGWDLPEGELSVCYHTDDSAKQVMDSIQYRFKSTPSVFGGGLSVSSYEEMAKLVNIDLQGRKPDVKFRRGFAYNDLILNGKLADVAFDAGPKGTVGVRVNPK